MQQTISTFKDMLIPVPSELLGISDKLSAVLSLVSTMAKSSAQIHSIYLGVQNLQQNWEGISTLRYNVIRICAHCF
jgi:hypothetical protein